MPEIKKHLLDDPFSYELLVFYLKQGREIEFKYDGVEYFISHESKGRAVWQGKIQLSDFFYIDSDDEKQLTLLLNKIKIENKSLKTIFQNHKAFIGTIF